MHYVRFALAIALSLLAGACSSAAPDAQASHALVIHARERENLLDPLVRQFEIATGIDVEVTYERTPEMAADVFLAREPVDLAAVESKLGSLPASILDRVPTWARSPSGNWVGYSATARVVAYNTKRLTEADLPDSISDFVDPKWRGRIGVPHSSAFGDMVTGMRALWGEQRTRQWLEGLVANEVVDFELNGPAVEAVAAGKIDVAFVNHYYLYRFLAEHGESFAARNYHPRDGGPGALMMVSGAGIFSTASNRAMAERFLEFLLSDVAQQYWASQASEYPLVKDVVLQRGMPPLETIRHPEIALQGLADREGTQALLKEVGLTGE